jgi:hypothetical protein
MITVCNQFQREKDEVSNMFLVALPAADGDTMSSCLVISHLLALPQPAIS